ncbi:MAG: glutamate 5-kinase [Actinomycetes bacterium]
MKRNQIGSATRVVIKIGSSTLTGKAGEQLDKNNVESIVDVVAYLRAQGKEVVLVSSGAIAAGLAPLGMSVRPKDLATQQAAASVGQGLLISYYNEAFTRHSLISSQVLLTIDDVVRRAHYQNAQRTLFKLLQLGVVPIINENDTVGVQEIRFGDNDRLAALVSHLIGADLLVLVTDIDGLYDAPPSSPGAKRIAEVADVTKLVDVQIGGVGSSGVGSGGMITKIDAARIATGAGVSMLLTSLEKLSGALTGEDEGTFFEAVHDRKPSRLLWLAHASTPSGKLIVDDGAVTALRERGVSLLPAGVKGVEGDFISGDTVELVSLGGEVVARGLVAFDAAEIPKMLGKSTKELAQSFGPEYERELVHRDDLVLL